ncbi:hypothetical protein PAXRUDRAFT_764399 [Paxillus rubicundulus Ve08.2h10]|uniref:Uncharacterized protein n=1 Tax=Paxillus rubicundulus Ve08.2h10 TaxID=930991 RepID=A0A0D0CYR8_9AGAM|nr:hypothetical protein PAXRUDRAFT_764399 [Paxillus rubicundulus Ve08.2h10]
MVLTGRRVDLVEDLIKQLEAVEVKDPSSTALAAGNISTLNCTICQILFKMMGTVSSDYLPQPVNDPTKYWIKLDDNGNETESGNDVLCPKFQDSWTANTKWHQSFFQCFCRDASAYGDLLAQDAVDRITDKQLKSTAGKVFKNMKERFKEENQPIGIQALNVQIGRQEKRQIEVVLTVMCYMAVHSGSDVEEEDGSSTSDDDHQSQLPLHHQAFKKKKSLVFTTHPLGWCFKQFCHLLGEICCVIDEDLWKKENQKKPGLKRRAVCLCGLPNPGRFLPKHETMKTPWWAVSTHWLMALHQADYDDQHEFMTDEHESQSDPQYSTLSEEQIMLESST